MFKGRGWLKFFIGKTINGYLSAQLRNYRLHSRFSCVTAASERIYLLLPGIRKQKIYRKHQVALSFLQVAFFPMSTKDLSICPISSFMQNTKESNINYSKRQIQKNHTGTVATSHANKISTHQKAGFILAQGMQYYQHHPPPEIFLCIDILCPSLKS